MKNRKLQVIETRSGEVVKTVDVNGSSDSRVEKIMSGMLRNMDTNRFHIVDSNDEKPR